MHDDIEIQTAPPDSADSTSHPSKVSPVNWTLGVKKYVCLVEQSDWEEMRSKEKERRADKSTTRYTLGTEVL
jgi:hypothetical protein